MIGSCRATAVYGNVNGNLWLGLLTGAMDITYRPWMHEVTIRAKFNASSVQTKFYCAHQNSRGEKKNTRAQKMQIRVTSLWNSCFYPYVQKRKAHKKSIKT